MNGWTHELWPVRLGLIGDRSLGKIMVMLEREGGGRKGRWKEGKNSEGGRKQGRQRTLC